MKKLTNPKTSKKTNTCCTTECCCQPKSSPFVAITAVISGVYLVIVILTLIFAKEQLGIVVGIIWGFVALALIACISVVKSQKKL